MGVQTGMQTVSEKQTNRQAGRLTERKTDRKKDMPTQTALFSIDHFKVTSITYTVAFHTFKT